MDQDTLIILATGAALVAVAVVPFLWRARRLERRARAAAELAERYGLHEPVSLHPVVHPGECIGTGACVSVCPEGDVLGIRDGQAHTIAPARCVGHGLCERACPVQAITLVFGTATRGVELPRVQGNFETNVPGLFIVGELGGMGLIRNAFEQGRQCVEGIARRRERGAGEELDVLVVGAGPAGLSASLHCQRHGLRFRTVEREDVGGTVRYYPRKKIVMTQPMEIPGYGKLREREIPKERLVEVWEEVIARTGLTVATGETVERVERRPEGGHTVSTSKGVHHARFVILAIGRRGVPRKLGIPGEQLPKVSYSLLEPEAYQHDRVMVVGGGDSAVEAAIALADQPGNVVHLSYRQERFSRIKAANQARIDAAIRAGRVTPLWRTNLTAITSTEVAYRDEAGAEHRLPNSQVFIFAGGELPTPFLRACGVQIETKFGER
ncbi:MAG TPA: NAD(P)-binding domain-containing protein [Gemmatimonadales bacterium]|nr:NAD(P)-binding domain-containing protein [Gemmatimonadales bacterium]